MDISREIYPMPCFAGLEVADTAASSRWYQEALGFADIFTLPGPAGRPMLVHLRFAKYADVLLRPVIGPAPGPKGVGFTLSFNVENLAAVDALAERARKAGAMLVTEPGNRPWNARDFTIADPDGFRLTFTAGPVEANLSFEAVMDRRPQL